MRAEMEGETCALDRATLEGLAECVHADRRGDPARGIERDSARGIALGQHVDVETDSRLPPGCDGIAIAPWSLVIVRPSRDGATVAIRILHELAHLVLQRLGWRHTHADVWYLALAMAAPSSTLRAHARDGGGFLDLAALARIPAWAAEARLSMTSVMRR